MKLFDSNLLIYSFQPAYTFLQADLLQPDVCVSAVSKLEVLGYPSISKSEKAYFEQLFSLIQVIDIDKMTIDAAINLRQMRKMSVGDAIIGATAQLKQMSIHTHNITDFNWIRGLTVVDPLVN